MATPLPKSSRTTTRLQDREQGRRNPQALSATELVPIAWRNRLTTHNELLPIWDILERIAPDADTKNIQQEIAKVRENVDIGAMARRIRLWQLTTGFNTDHLLCIVAKDGLGVDTLAIKNQPHLLRRLMDLPVRDLNLTAAQIAQTIHAFTNEDSQHYEGSQKWIDATVSIDRGITALNLTAALIDNWSISKQISEAKAALKPADKEERAGLAAQVEALRKEIFEADSKKQAEGETDGNKVRYDLDLLNRVKRLLLLEIRLYPEKNQQLVAVLQDALNKLETAKKNAAAGAKRSALVLGVDVSQVLLTAVEPSGLAAKLVGLAWKTYNVKAKITSRSDGIGHIQHYREEKSIAKRAIRRLESRGSTEEDKALLKTVEKVHRAYWSHQTQPLISEILLKSMGFASFILGIPSVLIKILAIVGVIAVAGVTLTTFGYLTFAIAGTALLIRLICYIYQHRHEMTLYLKKALLVVRKSFYELSIMADYKKPTTLSNLAGRIKNLDESLANHRLTAKLSGVAPELIYELGQRLAAIKPNKLKGMRKAQLAIQAITGKSAHYLDDARVWRISLSPEEIIDRALVSLIAQLGGFNLSNVTPKRRREDREEAAREALVGGGDLVQHHQVERHHQASH